MTAPGSIEIGGRTLLVSCPTEKDIFAVLQYARKQVKRSYNPIKEAQEALAGIPGVTAEQQTAILLQAWKVKAAGEIPEDAVNDYITGKDGCAFYGWILTRKSHPEVTAEQWRAWVTDDNSIQVYADLDEASGVNLIKGSMADNPFFHPPLTKNPGSSPTVEEKAG